MSTATHQRKVSLAAIRAAVARHGLIPRGGFVVEADDGVPDIAENVAAKYLLLFGNTGSSLWEAFSRSAEYRDHRPDPLNRWSERIGRELAAAFSARALFPFGGPPYRPFLRWAKKAENLQNSRLGMLIHPQFGLWHAYRFALALDAPLAGAPSAAAEGICRRCRLQPCLRACPVNAFGEAGYDVESCFRYLQSNPESKCMAEGCQARVACPEGAAYRYAAPHAAFHMRAFVAALAAGEFSTDAAGRGD